MTLFFVGLWLGMAVMASASVVFIRRIDGAAGRRVRVVASVSVPPGAVEMLPERLSQVTAVTPEEANAAADVLHAAVTPAEQIEAAHALADVLLPQTSRELRRAKLDARKAARRAEQQGK